MSEMSEQNEDSEVGLKRREIADMLLSFQPNRWMAVLKEECPLEVREAEDVREILNEDGEKVGEFDKHHENMFKTEEAAQKFIDEYDNRKVAEHLEVEGFHVYDQTYVERLAEPTALIKKVKVYDEEFEYVIFISSAPLTYHLEHGDDDHFTMENRFLQKGSVVADTREEAKEKAEELKQEVGVEHIDTKFVDDMLEEK